MNAMQKAAMRETGDMAFELISQIAHRTMFEPGQEEKAKFTANNWICQARMIWAQIEKTVEEEEET